MLPALVALAALSGCNAVTTAIEHRDLIVENKMTDTVFLDPVSSSQKTIYLQVSNTTDRQEFDLATDLKQPLEANGYSVVSDPARAHYLLQANVLQVGKMEKSTMQQLFAGGFGGASVIGATGYGAGISPWLAASMGSGMVPSSPPRSRLSRTPLLRTTTSA